MNPPTPSPDLAALIRRNTVAGGFANTVAIAEEAFEMGVKSAAPPAVERQGVTEPLGRRAQQFACDHIARFARGGYLRAELGDVLEEFAQQEAARNAAGLTVETEPATLASVERKMRELQADAADNPGLTIGAWVAGRLKEIADRSLSPTLHPSDREEGKGDASGFDLVGAIVRHMSDDLGFVVGHMPNEDQQRFYRLRDKAREWLIVEGARLAAILALSGSLAPANPTEKGEL